MTPAVRRLAAAMAAAGLCGVATLAQARSYGEAGAGFTVSITARGVAPASQPRGPADEARQRLFELINAERAKSGLRPLAQDAGLGEVAQRHSEDMRANGFVAHVSPTAGTTEERLARAGLSTDLAAENVGRGTDIDEIHRGFMNSPGHRAAILLAGATHVGLGLATKTENDLTAYYVTELFFRRIPPIGPDARETFLAELNRRRAAAGSPTLEEAAAFSRLADETALAFLKDRGLSEEDIMRRLQLRLVGLARDHGPITATLSVSGSIQEGAERATAEPKALKARRVGVGIVQGTRPGMIPNAIVLVLIYIE